MKLAHSLVMIGVLILGTAPVSADHHPPIDELAAMRGTDPSALLPILERLLAEIDLDTDELYVAHLHRLRAATLRERGQYDRAREDAAEFESIARKLDDPLLISRSLVLHGTIDAEQNNIGEALDRFHEARRLLEDAAAPRELSKVNMAIGVAHNFAFDFVRARRYYEEALRLARLAGDAELETSALGNLALAVSEIEGPDVGLPMHRQALALAEKRGDLHGVALQSGLICERLMQLERLAEARATCLEALDQAGELQLSRLLAGLRMTLGDISREEGNLSEAVAYYETAMDDAAGVVPSVVSALHEKLSEIKQELGDIESALHHLRALMSLREEAHERERQSIVEELEVRYKVEQRERQLEVVTLDARLQEAQLRQRSLLLLAATIGLALACLVALIAWRGFRVKSRLERELDSRNRALEEAVEQIGRLARTDSLTGLWNRRALEELATDELSRSKRSGRPLTVALADIDRFKALNDRLGHYAGDEVLRALSGRLRAAVRRTDSVCRWGGEEFLFLLPDNDTSAAVLAMERLRHDLAKSPLLVEGESISITMTIGIASVDDDIDAAIRRADAALYEGKRNGRDRVVVAGPATTAPSLHAET